MHAACQIITHYFSWSYDCQLLGDDLFSKWESKQKASMELRKEG
ncbi:hypothetical protein VCRA2133E348_230075 [Vibrio crassostreae]|nr:hypothetical protein VCRA2133E348_230075 [Vibrio crassostreae]CAK3266234.1 hypothetical protein VCRA213O314_220005 [Vibrio crassostreae]